MATQPNRIGRFPAGAATVLLLMLPLSSVFASNAFKPECNAFEDPPPTVEPPTPVLVMRVADHGLTDSSADMTDSASDPTDEKVVSPALAEVADVNLPDSSDTSAAEEDDAIPATSLPETAVKLPGVSEKEQPRFRRQMYRTDI